MNSSIHDKFNKNNIPKRILALDGGGVRGALTLGYLERVETLLRKRFGNENLVLSDYYDLIGGTSTGAIIASCLAIGKPVKDVIALYQDLSKKVFGKSRFPLIPRSWTNFRAIFKASYKSEIIEKLLKDNLGNTTLCDYNTIKCGLGIMSKRADTYSLWSIANHPDGKYTETMKHLELWELCRASAAAPYYFAPKKLILKTRTGNEFDAAFIDGGLSLANNPALNLFLTATIPSFGFNWTPGEHNIFITSFGTGNGVNAENVDKIVNISALSWAPKLSDLFMTDALEMNQVILQLFGRNYAEADVVDSQYNDLKDVNYSTEKLFSFIRYNVKLTNKYLKDELGIEKDEEQIKSLVQMDHFENIDALIEIGRKAAQKITSINFPTQFD